jgi:sugar (pentulose or hexulose) kinase
MSDLRIVVIDENDNVLRELEIYEDGSDSEACDTIAKAIGEKFESLATLLTNTELTPLTGRIK